VVLSRGHQLPCGYPPILPVRPRASRSPVVSPTPRPFGPVAWFPHGPRTPFPRGVSTSLPGPPGLLAAHRPGRTASPASKRSSFNESVRVVAGEPTPTVAALLDFFPFRDPVRTSEPSTRSDPSIRAPVPRRAYVKQALPVTSDREDQQPSRPGEPVPPALSEDVPRPDGPELRGEIASSAAFDPLRDRAAPPLGGVSFSPGLRRRLQANLDPSPDLRSFEVLGR